MKILLLVNVITFLSLIGTAQSQTAETNDQEEVSRTISLISNAWSQNNLDTLEKYISKDYKHTDVRSDMLDRATWLSFVKERKEKNIRNSDIVFEDTQIKIYNDFAFVTGINAFSGQAYVSNDSGSQKPRRLRYTQVLRKENNIWKRLIFQATYIESH